jgi:hypothetical protein
MQSDKNNSFESKLQPGVWELRANNLKRAADNAYEICYDAIIRIGQCAKEGGEQNPQDHQDVLVIKVYYLLMGYALENLLKGILIMRKPEKYVQQGSLKGLKTHKLVKLFEDCRLPVDPETKKLLEKLTLHIKWQGRYPVSLRAEDMELDSYNLGAGRKIQEELDQLYELVSQEFKKGAIPKLTIIPIPLEHKL